MINNLSGSVVDYNLQYLGNVIDATYSAINDKQGSDIIILDITSVSELAEVFAIASANNPNHVKAIADNIQEKLAKLGVKPKHVEGNVNARWMLMDFGSVVVHLFLKEEREYYRLEKLWADARQIVF